MNVARFLVATDFSACSMAALRTAVELAKRLNARMLLVHAAEPSGSLRSDPLRIDELSQKRDAHQFQKIISTSRGDEVITEKIVITGNPVKVILDQAKHQKSDLIVIGTQGRRGMKRLMLGSVAEAVVRRASCPVFTVRTQVRDPFNLTNGTRRSPPGSSTG